MRAGELRRIAWERQHGRCAATGAPLGDLDGGWDLHHRLAGGMGGTSRDRQRPSNVLALLPEAHNMGSPGLIVDGVAGRSVHTDPSWARHFGLLLSQSEPRIPESVPVRIAGLGWVFLLDDGSCLPLA